MSWSVTISPSIPVISVMWVTRRAPSRRRSIWTIRSIADAICSRIALVGRSKPAIRTMVSSRDRASRGAFACTVDSEPSCPVFIAWRRSSASAPRTSPMMMRSGRMRSALRTRSRMLTCPLPSLFGGRASRRTTCSWWSWSSTASSIVTMRSFDGTKLDNTFSIVVLPVPVPPEMRMFRPPATPADRAATTWSSSVPIRTRSSAVKGSAANLRIVRIGPSRDSGGRIALTRDPSESRASTIGDDSSMRRPTEVTMRSITRRRCSSDMKRASVRSTSPARST